MGIRHLDDGRFVIVPPTFLWWPAKHVILSIILANAIITTFFLLQASNILASILLCSILLSIVFAMGYIRESFALIYIHFIYCLLYIVFSFLFIPTFYYDQKICTNAAICKTVQEWLEELVTTVASRWIYAFTGTTLITHIMMTPVSLRMMKYSASCEALEKMMTDEEYVKKMKRLAIIHPERYHPASV
ncbi:uncharacterized protein CELE_C48B4.8 [Caenorhabditis elegans]|nr:Transmembrane protein [Caenorhabditis elegans]CAX51631.1 Transmembrane protein [Caenorhabditis elegans]|eukprot:NP_001255011.1 Uncharacterized protein CELE_C48B4.8 [Caenorhabditis elegans]